MLTCADVWWQGEGGGGHDKKDERGEKREGEADMHGNGGEKEVLSCTHLL